MMFVVALHRANVQREANAEPRTTSADDCTESAIVMPSISSRAPDCTLIWCGCDAQYGPGANDKVGLQCHRVVP